MKELRNVVMVTLDCVRPDHLGCYGYSGVDTPVIDELAAGGFVCDQAFCQAPNTWVSHGSIFSGCTPLRHGIHSPFDRLHTDVPTLAELLRARGYRTASFPAHNLVGPITGLDRGFDHVCDTGYHSPSETRPDAMWRPNWPEVVGDFERWIGSGGGPFFAWLHYIETHKLPHVELPEPFTTRFSPDWQYYDGKISLCDSDCIDRILETLDGRDALEDTLLVIFSDHGEVLRPGREPYHNLDISEGVMRIPIIFSCAGGGVPVGRVSSLVRSTDIAPTVLDILGAQLVWPSPMDGASILPLLGTDCVTAPAREAYMENLPKGYMGLRSEEWKIVLQTRYEGSEDVEVIGIEGLYQLGTDPDAVFDLSGTLTDRTWQWIEKLRALVDETMRPSETIDGPDEEKAIEQSLRDLGYI